MADDPPVLQSRADLRADLREIGVVAGDVVMVHAAMSKVGPLLNGPDALIGALLDVVGPESTLVTYTSWDSVHDDLLDADGRVLAEWRTMFPGSTRCGRAGVWMMPQQVTGTILLLPLNPGQSQQTSGMGHLE